MLTSVGVLVGVALAAVTGWTLLDPLVALVVPGRMSVARAHEICDRIERALKEERGEAVITIHVEPENKAKHTGVLAL